MLGLWRPIDIIVEAKYLAKWNPELAKDWFDEVRAIAETNPLLGKEFNHSAKETNNFFDNAHKNFWGNIEPFRIELVNCELELEDYLALLQHRG